MPRGSVQVIKTTGKPADLQLKKREAQDAFLAYVQRGVKRPEAMRKVGRMPHTFFTWCNEEQWFKDRYEALRSPDPVEDSDFATFRLTYFGHETPGHQAQIIDVINTAKPGSVNMILLPPGGGKTTVLEDHFNHKLAIDPNWRFCVISESQFHARKILANVANRMVDRGLYPGYINTYGPFKAEDRELQRPWGADAIKHVRASSGERDYSLEAKGAGTAVYGASFDDIVLDDVQSNKSQTKTESLLEYFRQVLYSRIMRANSTGRIFIIGTRQGPSDFYEELLRDDVVDNLVQIPALDEHGHSYFPMRKTTAGPEIGFTEDKLTQIARIVGPEAWSRQYMQEPISRHGQVFTDSMIRACLDETRGIASRHDSTVPGMLRMGSLDPAVGGHAVFRIASYDFTRLYLLDGKNCAGLGTFEAMWDIMEEFSEKWHPNVWVIEGNNIQGGLIRAERVEHMARRFGFTTVAHQTGKNKMDDAIGVKSMASSFLRKEVSIPWGDPEAKECFEPMLEELKTWRDDVPTRMLRQDEVMALWFLHLQWHKERVKLASRIDTHINVGGLPWHSAWKPPMNFQRDQRAVSLP